MIGGLSRELIVRDLQKLKIYNFLKNLSNDNFIIESNIFNINEIVEFNPNDLGFTIASKKTDIQIDDYKKELHLAKLEEYFSKIVDCFEYNSVNIDCCSECISYFNSFCNKNNFRIPVVNEEGYNENMIKWKSLYKPILNECVELINKSKNNNEIRTIQLEKLLANVGVLLGFLGIMNRERTEYYSNLKPDFYEKLANDFSVSEILTTITTKIFIITKESLFELCG